ncbi:SMCs flexible hinge [Phakopsora pachyrhizi]|uniref:SMCs flexible hinge n=1 Tax=Phakopsora pachyrhizi TaxID=170000 RepID=A0AAV0BW08_PHAPC|nr:SMCs flexible hinge [Phakopsora pachyrhizi]
MILLNQIFASRVSGDSAKLTLHLVGYEQDVCRAIKFVFGNKMICPDARTAKEVTFDQKVSMKSITQDGNIYNPSGTLSGGSKPSTSGILIKVLELKKVEGLLKDHQSKLEVIKKGWQDAIKESNATHISLASIDLLNKLLIGLTRLSQRLRASKGCSMNSKS